MLIVIADRFKQKYPNSEIHIFTDATDSLEKLIPYAIPGSLAGRRQWNSRWNMIGGLHKLFPKSSLSWLAALEMFFKLKYPHFSRKWIEKRLSKRGYDIEPMRTYLNSVVQADVVVASGGGYITDSFEGHTFGLLSTIALAQVYGKPTALFGQGLGPVKNQNLMRLIKLVLPKLHSLTLRESLYSKPFASSVGVPENVIAVTGDDAITFAYSKQARDMGNAIGVNLRISSYSGIKEHVLNDIKDTLKNAAESFNAELLPIPISFHNGDSDIESLRKLFSDDAVQYIRSLDSPQKVIEQISLCRIVVTGSYHAGVFALSQGISVIGITASDYYRHKFEGLAFQFGPGCLIVDQESKTFMTDLKEAINNSWKDADIERHKLLEQARFQISLSELAYDNFMTNTIQKD